MTGLHEVALPRAPVRLRGARRVAPLLCAMLSMILSAQAQAQDADAQAETLLATLKESLREYEMGTVESTLRSLDGIQGQLSPKLAGKLGKGVAAVFKTRPRPAREEGEDTREELIDSYHLAIGLVFEREEGGAILEEGLKQAHLADWPEMRVRFVEGLGYRREASRVGLFSKLLADEQALVAGAAARALGELSEQPLPLRRAAVAALVEAWTAADGAASRERGKKKEETVAQERLARIEGPFELALQRLARQGCKGLPAWTEWQRTSAAGLDW